MGHAYQARAQPGALGARAPRGLAKKKAEGEKGGREGGGKKQYFKWYRVPTHDFRKRKYLEVVGLLY